MNLYGKNIILTGASRGFGCVLAKHLWEQGANLFLISRTSNYELKYGFLNYTPFDQHYLWLNVDLCEDGALDSILKNFVAYFGAPYALINNAAIQAPIGHFWKSSKKDWDRCIALNLTVPADLMRLFLPLMIAQKSGRIINLSGGGASEGRPDFSAYATAKTGLVRLTETIAMELDGTGITANCIAPGMMFTNMTREILKSKANQKEKEKARIAYEESTDFNKPLALVDWLLSEKSDGVSGRLISAVWDDYKHFNYKPDFGTLRRVS